MYPAKFPKELFTMCIIVNSEFQVPDLESGDLFALVEQQYTPPYQREDGICQYKKVYEVDTTSSLHFTE
jgi:hypothetical protein